jgi:hypothetical protein
MDRAEAAVGLGFGNRRGVRLEQFVDLINTACLGRCINPGLVNHAVRYLLGDLDVPVAFPGPWRGWSEPQPNDLVRDSGSLHRRYIWRQAVMEAEPKHEIAIAMDEISLVEAELDRYVLDAGETRNGVVEQGHCGRPGTESPKTPEKMARLEELLAVRAGQLHQVEGELARAIANLDQEKAKANALDERVRWTKCLAQDRLTLLQAENEIRRRLAAELAQARADLDRANGARHAIETSTIWRATLPLRAAAQALRLARRRA